MARPGARVGECGAQSGLEPRSARWWVRIVVGAVGAAVAAVSYWFEAHLVVLPALAVVALALVASARPASARPEVELERLVEKYTDSSSRFVELEGLKIHFRDEGSGRRALLLLHGVCASLHTWDGWVERMASEVRVIRMDLPGFGLTGPAPRSLLTRERAVAMLDAFLDELGIEAVVVGGNSLGGYIAWNYALARPDRVEGLLLVDPVGFNQPLPWAVELGSHPLVRPFARRVMPRFMFERCLCQVYGDPRRITSEVRDRYFEMARRPGNQRSYIDVFTVMRELCDDQQLSQGIDQIEVPTLVMWGERDEWVPFEHLDRWRRALPSASFRSYPGVGHAPMEEVPGQTAEDALEFLRSLRG